MARVRRIVNEDDLRRYFRSLSAVESSIKSISQEDVQEVGDKAVDYIREIFPKASGTRNTYYPEGSRTAQSRGSPLYRGWRTYTISEGGNIGVRVQHIRINNESVRKILASLDQGSKSYMIYLQHGDYFRFKGKDGSKVIVPGRAGDHGVIKIPSRPALPTPAGYIKPTADHIKELIDDLRKARAESITASYATAKKVARRDLIRSSYYNSKVRKIIGDA